MVPILQDVSQLKTLFPQDKWEIFSSNCAAVVYLGSGPTAYTTHKWISDMLGEMTIDTRSESISQGKSGSSSLQNSKAGMKLMTPEQIREIEAAAVRPVVPDEDAPELTLEQYAEMAQIARSRRSQKVKPVVALRVSPETLEKAKATGKGYTGFLSRLLDNAINDPQIVAKSM